MSSASVTQHGSQWISERLDAAQVDGEVMSSALAERRPRPELAAWVASLWLERGDGGLRRARVLPDGFIDLVWGTRLWVRGPDTRHHLVRYSSDATFVGVRFRPGAAPPILGVEASALVDQRVPLIELWGRTGSALEERLAATRSIAGAMVALEDALCERARRSGQPDEIVRAFVTATGQCSSPMEIRALAHRVNLSERQLRRRCTAALGYGPKMLDRILRLQRVLVLARRQPTLTIGDLATRAGYADQAHLTRECRRLSGETPSALLCRAWPRTKDGRFVQDGAAVTP